jgi:hypothetical protein
MLARTAPAIGGMTCTRASSPLRGWRTIEYAPRAIPPEIAVVQPCFWIVQVTGGLKRATTPHIVQVCFALVRYDDAR